MVDPEPPRRRASDYEKPKRTLGGWLAENVTLALILGAIVGAGGLLIGGVLWYASVNGLGPRIDKIESSNGLGGRVAIVEPKVTLLEARLAAAEATLTRMQADLVSADKRLNDMREKIDHSDAVASEVRRTLDATDNQTREMIIRIDEQVKAANERLRATEAHFAPLPFNPPPTPGRGSMR